MTSQHFVVVGAGIIGVSAALRLAQAGARVTLIDRGAPGSGTTGTTGAMVGSNEKRPWEYYDLGVRSMAAMQRLADQLKGSENWFLPTGHLEWANTEETQQSLDERVERLLGWGYDVTRLSPTQVMQDLEPDLIIPSDVEEVTFFSADSIVYQHPMLAGMLRALRSLDVEMRFGSEVSQLLITGDAVSGVIDSRGDRITADAVVVCAGRWTDKLLAQVDFELPLVDPWGPTPETLGLQVITTGVAAEVSRMIRMPGLSIRPAGGGRLMLHGRPEERSLHALGPEGSGLQWDVPLDPIPREADDLVAKASRVMHHMQSAQVQSATASIRPLTGDGLPAVGWVPTVANLYTAVTHSGIGLGPLLGELIAAEVAQGSESELLATFRPARFQSDDWMAQASPMREIPSMTAPIN